MTRDGRGWRNDLQLRRGVKQLLRELDLETPLDVRVLCERLGQHRGRPISLVPYPFFLGIGYPGARTGIIKARLWCEVRRHYRQLRPLWTQLYQRFPHIALFPPVPASRERFRVRGMRLRYYRRVIECRDGLVCLRPYLAEPVHSTESRARQAELVRDALTRETPVDGASAASVIAAPEARGMDADTHELLALARELNAGVRVNP